MVIRDEKNVEQVKEMVQKLTEKISSVLKKTIKESASYREADSFYNLVLLYNF